MSAGSSPDTTLTWQPLGWLAFYRLLLAVLFVLLPALGLGPGFLGTHAPQLFEAVSVTYLALAALLAPALWLQRPAFGRQLYAGFVLDLVALTLIMHASGGIQNGLGMLILVAVAAASLLMSGRVSPLTAALGTFAILGEQLYADWQGCFAATAWTQAGTLGAACFATALVTRTLARRAQASAALAEQRGVDLANMEQLNAYILRRLPSGILVVDGAGRVRLSNDSAAHLLGPQRLRVGEALRDCAPALSERLSRWRATREDDPTPLRASPQAPAFRAHFTQLVSPAGGCVILLEDEAVTAEKAQQWKLAALGRLAAGIAHEVRNPLGAISHAGQLLGEAEALAPGDRRLVDIIHHQSQRVNAIVEDMLALARRQPARAEVFELLPWLNSFAADLIRERGLAGGVLTLTVEPPGLRVRMDRGHLQQVLWNLCDNALRHGVRAGEAPRLTLRGRLHPEARGPVLEVEDHGPGITAEQAAHLFEPFSSSAGGSGLGLYLARELCEHNQARLGCHPAANGGACFRMVFADPERQVL